MLMLFSYMKEGVECVSTLNMSTSESVDTENIYLFMFLNMLNFIVYSFLSNSFFDCILYFQCHADIMFMLFSYMKEGIEYMSMLNMSTLWMQNSSVYICF